MIGVRVRGRAKGESLRGRAEAGLIQSREHCSNSAVGVRGRSLPDEERGAACAAVWVVGSDPPVGEEREASDWGDLGPAQAWAGLDEACLGLLADLTD